MSKEHNIQDGAFPVSRSLFGSDIWFMPPHYLKIWIWLIGKAEHKTKEKKRLKRGQCLVTIQETIEATKWKVGYREEKLTKKQVWGVYEWLRAEDMIVTMKVTRGMIVSICNYDFYQNLSNYEGNNEADTKRIRTGEMGNTKDKNVKNARNSFGEDSWQYRFAKRFWELKQKKYADYSYIKKAKENNFQDWADELDKLNRIDGKEQETIRKVLKFATEDDFWEKTLLSLTALRKLNDNGIPKFESIENKMKNPPSNNGKYQEEPQREEIKYFK